MDRNLLIGVAVGILTGIISSVIYETNKQKLNSSYISLMDKFMTFKNDGVKNA